MSGHLERDVADVGRRWVPDRRLGVFDVQLKPGALAGCTTSRDALAALRRLAATSQRAADIRLLPDAAVGEEDAAIVTAPLAPLWREPRGAAERVSEALHGETLAVLERDAEGWLRVRASDGYHAWVSGTALVTGPRDWADDWTARATLRSLGAELCAGAARFALPLGARLAPRRGGALETADGRVWERVGAGVVGPEIELRTAAQRQPVPAWTLQWFSGAPYLWGGRTTWGVDCSGLVQASYAARGVALPRDSDLQSLAGREVPLDPRAAGYTVGDVLCFADGRRVSHVALWAGAGQIVHAAATHGGVTVEDLFADTAPARRLRDDLVAVRRPLA